MLLHLFQDSMPEHKKIWDQWCDGYYLELLNQSLNGIPTPPKPFGEMREAEFNSWLSRIDFAKHNSVTEEKFKINPPSKQERCSSSQSSKTEVVNLKLSLEDNSTLTGTAEIVEQFGKEFSIPCPKNYEIPFNQTGKKFDINSARMQYEFVRSVELHRTEMLETEKQMRSREKQLDIPDENNSGSDTNSSEDSDTNGIERVAERTVQQESETFKYLYARISRQTTHITHSNEDDPLGILIQQLSNDVEKINGITDQYGRTIFSFSVELKNYVLVKVLLSIGINPNVKEGCGATAMTIAVLNNDLTMCKLLLENFAEYEGALFGSFPSPLEMATAMELTTIVQLFHSHSQTKESPIIDALQSFEYSFIDKQTSDNSTTHCMDTESNAETASNNAFEYKRSQYQGFPTAVVGDVGTCKINRSVKNRNSTAFSWMTEIPGDLHTKGHLCEAVFKAHSKGRFHKIVNNVMKRPKLTKEVFKKRKFQEQNLSHIKESVRDGSNAYGFAAVQEFKASEEFPSQEELTAALRKSGNHNDVLLSKFKKWLKICGECDDSHRYHQQMFSLFGPLLDMYITASREGDGLLRETVWVLLLPIFAQLNFRNYWTEAFVHVVNFTSLWPLAFRQMMKRNMSVNLNGKQGHNIDMDEYVETYIVRPLKTYASGKILSIKYIR